MIEACVHFSSSNLSKLVHFWNLHDTYFIIVDKYGESHYKILGREWNSEPKKGGESNRILKVPIFNKGEVVIDLNQFSDHKGGE